MSRKSKSVAKGSFLLLSPEDVDLELERSFYAMVKSVDKTSVLVSPIEADSVPLDLRVPISVAKERLVTKLEAIRHRSGLWLRQAVFFSSEEGISTGQVINSSSDRVQVRSGDQNTWIPLKKVLTDTYPLVAMLLRDIPLESDSWTTDDLNELSEQVISKILHENHMEPPSIRFILEDFVDINSFPMSSSSFLWLLPQTGTTHKTTLQHVIDYIFYKVGNNPLPTAKRTTIGDAFCDDPSFREATTVPPSGSNRRDVPVGNLQPSPPPIAREPGFFDVAPSSHSGASVVEVQAPISSPTARNNAVLHTDEVAAAIAVLSRYPGLLNHNLTPGVFTKPPSQAFGDSARSTAPVKRALHHSPGASPTPKRSKSDFTPTSIQQGVHALITRDELRGKSPMSFMSCVICSSSVLP